MGRTFQVSGDVAGTVFLGAVIVIIWGRAVLASILDREDDAWVVAAGSMVILAGWLRDADWLLILGVAVAVVGEFNHQTGVIRIGRSGRSPVRERAGPVSTSHRSRLKRRRES